ncbi:hypothetical protein NBRC3293_1185 [Gluconobacter oxydans NBRC 3293]|uniref:Uncharacterized protein n=1 Tax=Gluconobacter oxydans NBRC 3293 TaxID=1315969 RepID=A0A829WIP3_GLUOY|nr:hypothetical protein NBRC3293_1185 [Gluconobacter oxydans NBRC 3293]
MHDFIHAPARTSRRQTGPAIAEREIITPHLVIHITTHSVPVVIIPERRKGWKRVMSPSGSFR